MNFIPEIEKQTKGEIKRFQEGKLVQLIKYLSKNSPFYQNHFKKNGINPEEIKKIEDLTHIPPTGKDDIQKNNWDFLCVPYSSVFEYTSTSGTLGKPVTVAMTANDLERLAYNEYISFVCAGGSDKDIYQLMLTLDRQFMAGIAYYQGIKKLGAGVVRVGPGLPEMQLETIQRLKPTILVAVPSFLIKLIGFAEANGFNLNKTSVQKAVCIGESIRTADLGPNILAQKINETWNIRLYNTYASTEMQTAFTECNEGNGGHHHPELLIVELLDENNQPVDEGNPGEVTITTLGIEGMPLLRYKTGDVSVAFSGPCKCGRNTLRLGPVIGRKQEMIKLKGTTLYPPGIFALLSEIEEVKEYAVEAYTNDIGTDELRLHLLILQDPEKKIEGMIRTQFKSRFRVVPEIVYATSKEIEAIHFRGNSRKVKRFFDNRK